jgi:hypothetical protein
LSILVTLMMEAKYFLETSVLTTATRRHIVKDSILQILLCSYIGDLMINYQAINKSTQNNINVARFDVFTAVTMKNVVLWDIKFQFVPHRRQITFPLQSPAG